MTFLDPLNSSLGDSSLIEMTRVSNCANSELFIEITRNNNCKILFIFLN